MNIETIVAALITAGFAFLGVYMSNRKQAALVAYRLEKLEEKVDKHNSVVERMYRLEEQVKNLQAVTRIKNPDGCSMGSIYHEWLGVTSAETLTPAWTICYQR